MQYPRALTEAFLEKLLEQAERLQHLLALVPADELDWRPPVNLDSSLVEAPDEPGVVASDKSPVSPALCLGDLIGHLLECLAGFCAVLYAANPEGLAQLAALRGLPVNHHCGPEEASSRIDQYVAAIQEGFRLISDEALGLRVKTAFVEDGEPIMTLLLGNLEHLINHKYQLFLYLRMMGIAVGTPDLYRLRG